MSTNDTMWNILDELNRLTQECPAIHASQNERSIEDLLREAESLTSQPITSLKTNPIQNCKTVHTERTIEELLTETESLIQRKDRKSAHDTSKDVSYLSDLEDLSPDDPSIASIISDLPSSTANQSKHKRSSSQPPKLSNPNPIPPDLSSLSFRPRDLATSMSVPFLSRIADPDELPKLRAKSAKEGRNSPFSMNRRKSGGLEMQESLVKEYERDNLALRRELKMLRVELEDVKRQSKPLTPSPRNDSHLQSDLNTALEKIKDLKEHNTALQLQLTKITESHHALKSRTDELTANNLTLERQIVENVAHLRRLKSEVTALQGKNEQLAKSEKYLEKTIECEKLQNKSFKLQTEKDAKCILDLTRQVKEMERIIARKHPDSVSALIVTANNDAGRKVLEERIKQLETELSVKDASTSRSFVDIQEKFAQMKTKYEVYIDDLNKHVTDLKRELDEYKLKGNKPHGKDKEIQVHIENVDVKGSKSQSTNTIGIASVTKKSEREETHLLATIRGLSQELTTKERLLVKFQKELDELRRTNRRLQKEREGVLIKTSKNVEPTSTDEESAVKNERDMFRDKLQRLEREFDELKRKRIDDLQKLQLTHEAEINQYIAEISPGTELITDLKNQLTKAKENIAVLTAERYHLESQLNVLRQKNGDGEGQTDLTTRIETLEQRYVDRELRLRAIIQSLAQKQTEASARNCDRCVLRQQQMQNEQNHLDQLINTNDGN